jgi:hypothetical protein
MCPQLTTHATGRGHIAARVLCDRDSTETPPAQAASQLAFPLLPHMPMWGMGVRAVPAAPIRDVTLGRIRLDSHAATGKGAARVGQGSTQTRTRRLRRATHAISPAITTEVFGSDMGVSVAVILNVFVPGVVRDLWNAFRLTDHVPGTIANKPGLPRIR